jgi:hypothetical protein
VNLGDGECSVVDGWKATLTPETILCVSETALCISETFLFVSETFLFVSETILFVSETIIPALVASSVLKGSG